MSNSLFIALFLLIVFAPCLVAIVSNDLDDSEFPEIAGLDKRRRPGRGAPPVAAQAMDSELPLAEDFEIRSFPKGIAQLRILVRDDESGVKLTIRQVRAAAVELIKLGGMVAAHRFAMMAAAVATAMHNAKDAYAIAAREVLEAARTMYAWLDRGDGVASGSDAGSVWAEASPPPAEVPRRFDHLRWSEVAAQADLEQAAAA